MELAHTPSRKTRTCSSLDGKGVGQVCTETLELGSHFPVLTNLTALRSLQEWPDLSWTRDKLREEKPAAQTDPLHLEFTPRKGQTWPTTIHPIPGHPNLIPSPSHFGPDLCQQKFYSMLQTEFIAFLGLIYAMSTLATEKEFST